MASNMFLYWGSGSGPCWKAMLALEEKGLSGYGQKLISFEKKEHKSDEIMKLNPRGQVPTFKHGDIILNESQAIVDYLEISFKDQGTKLVPDDPALMAQVLQRRHEIASNYPAVFAVPIVYYIWTTEEGKRDEELLNKRYQRAREELEIWERFMPDGEFVVGNKFTLADLEMIVALSTIVRFGCTLEKYPKLKKYYDNMKNRPSVVKTTPPHWKDSPGKDMFLPLNK